MILCEYWDIWGLLQITTANFMLVHSAFFGKFCLNGSSNARLLKMPQRRQKSGRHGKQRGCTMLLVFAKLIPVDCLACCARGLKPFTIAPNGGEIDLIGFVGFHPRDSRVQTCSDNKAEQHSIKESEGFKQ